MKKITALALVVALCFGLFAACGKESYDAQTNTVYILKKGKVVSKDVEDFDEDQYKASELEEYAKNTVREYTQEHGKGSVTFQRLEVKDNTASLTLKYASAEDYAKFTGTELFTGTITEALEAGYSFEEEFVDVDGQSHNVSTVLDNSKMKVAIVKGNLNLHVDGEIMYYTARNVVLVDKNTISIDPAYGEGEVEMGTEIPEETEETEQPTEGIIEEAVDAGADAGSVSDDEMLTGTESTEVSFDFKETYNARQTKKSQISDVYTYVVYK